MSVPESIPEDRAIFFDDESIESLLYGDRRTGPSNASAFTEVLPVTEEIATDLAAGRIRDASLRATRLLESERAVPLSALALIVNAFAHLIPQCPRPILSEAAGDCGDSLRALIVQAERYGADAISSRAHTLLYRWHEGRGEYARARSVIRPMSRRAQREGDLWGAASLVNNCGYEYLLEGRAAEAERYFEQAVERFTRIEQPSEISNARANLLTCRFALSGQDDRTGLVRELVETHRAMRDRRDWRVRKTQRLLAEVAAERGRWAEARRWARKAVAASGKIPTRLREDDEGYLRGLHPAATTLRPPSHPQSIGSLRDGPSRSATGGRPTPNADR